MKTLKKAALAALTAVAVACGTTPAVAQPVGVVKAWDATANPPTVIHTGKPQSWVKQVDHKTVLSLSLIHI